jgi:hypothetical protein
MECGKIKEVVLIMHFNTGPERQHKQCKMSVRISDTAAKQETWDGHHFILYC